jgi:8-oxo-dGTP pyrophosphatase MutT (NUDIX family)
MTQIISSRLIAKNKVFNVYYDHVKDQKYSIKNYLRLEPRVSKKNNITGVAVLPVFMSPSKYYFGLLQLERPSLLKPLWEIPRGFIEENSSDKASAIRELYEETGLKVTKKNLTLLGKIAPEPGVIQALVKLFVAEVGNKNQTALMGELGHKKFKFFSKKEVDRLIASQKILDSTSIVTYYRYLLKTT